MANFSVLQNRHLYVVKALANGGPAGKVAEDASKGTIGGFKVIEDGINPEMYFMYKGADTLLKSDSVQLKNVTRAEVVDAKTMRVPLRAYTVSLDDSVSSSPIAGQDYVLNIVFRGFFAPGADSQYQKTAVVHAVEGMTAANFYKAMIDSLNKAFSREDGATATSNPYLEFIQVTGTPAGILIIEKPQPWTLGIKKQRRIDFDVLPSTLHILNDDNTTYDEPVWGTVYDATEYVAETYSTKFIGNGKKIADLEWFAMGERGDQYRMKKWPNYIPTEYLVDPDQEYHVLELHHAYTDNGVNSYRSEKDITLVSTNKSYLTQIATFINAVLKNGTDEGSGSN